MVECPYTKKIYELLKYVYTSVPYDYETKTVGAAVIQIAPQKLILTNKVLITIETDSIRVRTDGQPPTAAEGHLHAKDTSITLTDKTEMENFSAIRVTTDATIKITYYAALREPGE